MSRASKTKKVRSDEGHRSCTAFFIVFSFLVLTATIVFGFFTSGLFDPIIFDRTIMEVYDNFKTHLEFSPESWVFYLWPAAGAWLVLWMLYGVGLICRKPGDGKGYLYFRPPFMPATLYGVFTLSLMLLVAWVTLWTKEMLLYSLGAIGLAALVGGIALYITVHAVRMYSGDLLKAGNDKDLGLSIALAHNGLGLYVAWLFVTALHNLNIVLVYEWSLDKIDASSIALGALGGVSLLYFLLDVLMFGTAMRFLVTPYIVSAMAFGSVIPREFAGGDRNYLITLFLTGFAGFAIFFKIAAIFGECRRKGGPHAEDEDPLVTDSEEDDSEPEDISEDESEEEGSEEETEEESAEESEESDDGSEQDDEETQKYIKKAKKLLSK